MEIRRIQKNDTLALLQFYNGLSSESKRLFRPLGEQTTLDACEKIIAANAEADGTKYDLIAREDRRIIGWSFLWELDEPAPTFGIGIVDVFQGKGLGRQLMDAVMKFAVSAQIAQIKLTVVQENSNAWRMYQRRGFVITGEFLDKDGLMYFRMVNQLQPYSEMS